MGRIQSRAPVVVVVAGLLVITSRPALLSHQPARAEPDAPARPQMEDAAYRNLSLSFEARAADLVSRMTLDEKVSQLMNDAPAIPRLGVPAYNWWNEALHGVARAGAATVFPQAIGMAATFDTALMHDVATAISDEARAKHHEFAAARPARRATRGSPSGRRTSTSSATRAGAAARRPTARIRSSPRGWASRSSKGCRATTRGT